MDGVVLPLQPWAEALVKKRAAGDVKDDPTVRCLPWGQPRLAAFSVQNIVQTPNLVVVLYEYLTTFRQIFIDGCKPLVNPEPAWMGYSIGRWDGDMLVVESTGFNGRSWLEGRGYPVTDALRLTERMQRPDFWHLDVRLTIDDPKAYTRPFDLTVSPQFQDTDLIEYVCNENERFVTQPSGR